MSAAKHTSGPWTYYFTISDTKSGRSVQVQTEPVGPEGGRYATEICRLSRTGEKNGAQEANARLIAAAPELLAALRVLVDHAQETYPHFESPRGQQNIAAALAAIAKATGGAS